MSSLVALLEPFDSLKNDHHKLLFKYALFRRKNSPATHLRHLTENLRFAGCRRRLVAHHNFLAVALSHTNETEIVRSEGEI